jgi:hypothetical protein
MAQAMHLLPVFAKGIAMDTADGALAPLTDDSDLCRTLSCGLELHSKLSREAYLQIGLNLAKAEGSLSWKIGDWVNHGDRHQIDVPDDYDGPCPARQTRYNRAWVCSAFEISRRREKLTFGHHAELVKYAPNEADEWLDWCEASIATTGKPRSIRAMRHEIDERRMEELRAAREKAKASAGDPEPRFQTQPLITHIRGSGPRLGEDLIAQVDEIIAGLKNPRPKPDAPPITVFVSTSDVLQQVVDDKQRPDDMARRIPEAMIGAALRQTDLMMKRLADFRTILAARGAPTRPAPRPE